VALDLDPGISGPPHDPGQHRFSTVRMADFIVVLDGGRVVESGGHEALDARGGQYAELYETQAEAYR
jgi:ATP-binding cassette, subfamily B, bacterial